MARFARLLPEPAWIVVSLVGDGHRSASATRIATSVPGRHPASSPCPGWLQPPSSVSRSVLLQRNTPREMRGRVFSAFYVMRDVIFLIGMAGAGLADFVDIRLLIIFASALLFVSAAFTLVAPGLGFSTWGAAARRLRGAAGAGAGRHPESAPPRSPTSTGSRSGSGSSAALSPDQRMAFVHEATVRDVPGRNADRRARRRRRCRRSSSSMARRRRASRPTTAITACRR